VQKAFELACAQPIATPGKGQKKRNAIPTVMRLKSLTNKNANHDMITEAKLP